MRQSDWDIVVERRPGWFGHLKQMAAGPVVTTHLAVDGLFMFPLRHQLKVAGMLVFRSNPNEFDNPRGDVHLEDCVLMPNHNILIQPPYPIQADIEDALGKLSAWFFKLELATRFVKLRVNGRPGQPTANLFALDRLALDSHWVVHPDAPNVYMHLDVHLAMRDGALAHHE
jgi:hypothetical protein